MRPQDLLAVIAKAQANAYNSAPDYSLRVKADVAQLVVQRTCNA